jgi:hypothetical protein
MKIKNGIIFYLLIDRIFQWYFLNWFLQICCQFIRRCDTGQRCDCWGAYSEFLWWWVHFWRPLNFEVFKEFLNVRTWSLSSSSQILRLLSFAWSQCA